MFIATTFSKTFGLYNDRIGALTVVGKKESREPLASHVRAIARACYSSPPAFGAQIISTILHDQSLKALWQQELAHTLARLKMQREMLHAALKKAGAKLAYNHLLTTHGLFCLFDLAPEKVQRLQTEHGVYIALDGRVSLATITEKNVDKVAQSIAEISS
jgi:aspartate/tyrosine/aromatic aminotransferase